MSMKFILCIFIAIDDRRIKKTHPKGQIYPIEVKVGKGGSLRSLHLMLEKYPNCPQGLVLYSDTYKQLPEQKLVFLPLYSVATLGDRHI